MTGTGRIKVLLSIAVQAILSYDAILLKLLGNGTGNGRAGAHTVV